MVSAEFNNISMVHSSTVSYSGCASHIDSIVSMCAAKKAVKFHEPGTMTPL